MKQNKRTRTIGVVAVLIVILGAALWLGGNAPDTREIPVQSSQVEQAAPAEPERKTLPQEPQAETPAPVPQQQTDAQVQPEPAAPAPEKGATELRETDAAQSSCTLSISCAAILAHMDQLGKEKKGLVPADGWLLEPITVVFQEGESVFDMLRRVCKEQKLHMEFEDTPIYNSAYIEGIGNLYEFDCGELSGWKYKVNGWFPNYGCSQYQLQDGDTVEWVYTCDLGADVGAAVGSGG